MAAGENPQSCLMFWRLGYNAGMKTNKVHIVEVQDLSSLGGPMGTEHITTIRRRLFSSEERAREFVVIYLETHGKHAIPNITAKNFWKKVGDLGSFGFRYSTDRID